MKKYVTGFMFSENREHIVLIIKNKPDWQKGLLNGIGGKIEYEDEPFFTQINKTPSQHAMMREFQEETGVLHEDWELFLTMGSEKGNSDTVERSQQYNEGWSVDFYRCFSDKIYDCITKTEEVVTVLTVNYALCAKTIDNLKWLIHLALDKNPKITNVIY